MNLKHKLVLSAGLLLGPTTKNQYSEKIYTTIQRNIAQEEKTDQQNKQQEKTISKNLQREKENPLKDMYGFRKTLGAMLGYSQAEYIIKNYNKITPQLEKYEDLITYTKGTETGGYNDIDYQKLVFDTLQKSISNASYKEFGNIKFPLIYPELKEFFPKEIKDIQTNKKFQQHKNILENNKSVIIVSRCENNKTALGWYKEGILELATYVSIGRNGSTLSGSHQIKLYDKYKRSSRYGNAPMPYAIQIKGNYFLHQGKSDGTDRSHGCIRVPGYYQEHIYNSIEQHSKYNNTFIILEGIYTPTLEKINNQVNKTHKTTKK